MNQPITITRQYHHQHVQVDDAGGIASLVSTAEAGDKGKDDVTGGMELKLGTAIAIQVYMC